MKIPLWSAWRERREWKLNAATSVLANAGVQIQTATGISVTEKKALTYLPLLACARVLAEDVASLPLITYERLPRGKRRATEHPLYDLLHTQPNPEMDSFLFRSTAQMHAATWGVSYSEIEVENGWPTALWPLTPWRVAPKRDPQGVLYYDVTPPSITDNQREVPVPIPSWRMLRVLWLTLDGINPISPVSAAREAIGLGLATGEFGSRFFANDARPGFVLKHPGALSDQAYKRLQSAWDSRHRGLSRAHRQAILEEGMDIKEVGIPPEDAQFLETRKFQAEDIARLYRMPQHKIGLLEHATFSNIEHQGIEYVVDTLRPWLVRWEMAILSQLFPEEERNRFFAEFLVDGLLRGDTASRYQAYATARQWGWMSANDVRALENLNPIVGGDIYMVPLNMVPADQLAAPMMPALPQAASRTERRSIATRHRLARAYHRMFASTAERIIRREKADVMRLANSYLDGRPTQEFVGQVNAFYAEHEAFVRREMQPVLTSYAEAVHADATKDVRAEATLPSELDLFVIAYLDGFVDRWVGSSRGQILSVVTKATAETSDPVAALADRFTEWLTTRPEKTATWETKQASNAVATKTWEVEGVREKVWAANANACPLCESLDGQTISITEYFAREGETLSADGQEPLTTDFGIGHPPLHDGCECSVVPG